MKKRVVITGIGVISPLGLGHQEFWNNLIQGKSGLSPITSLDVSNYPCKKAGEVSGLRPADYLGDKGLKYLTKGTKFLACATKLALEDAGLNGNNNLPQHTGIVVGSALGNYSQTTDYTYDILRYGPEKLLPMDSYDVALNSSINFASVFFKLKGPSRTVSSGFTSSADAIGNAFNLIRSGRETLLISGGVEQISLDIYLIFLMQRLLAGSQDSEPEISIPFDRKRNGFILSEGSYVFILEELESARLRGAKIYAEITGYGTSYMGSRRYSIEERVKKAAKAMALTLEDAGLEKESLELICANGNSSKLVDLVEARAINAFLGERSKEVMVSSIKSQSGECYGASGAMQMASCVLAMHNSTIPPLTNYEKPDPECELNLVSREKIEKNVKNAMVNSLDYTGNCSCLLLEKKSW